LYSIDGKFHTHDKKSYFTFSAARTLNINFGVALPKQSVIQKPSNIPKNLQNQSVSQNDPFPLPNFLRIDPENCTEIFTVCSVERNPEVFFGASVKKKLLCGN
jgi:hypothetical protein